MASQDGHLEVVRLLLESGAKDLPHKVIRLTNFNLCLSAEHRIVVWFCVTLLCAYPGPSISSAVSRHMCRVHLLQARLLTSAPICIEGLVLQ